MSRRRAKGARPRGGDPPRRRARWPWLLLVVPLILLGVWRVLPRPARHEPRTPPGLESMSPQQAYDRGLDLGMQGHPIESLPYLRRAAGSPSAIWVVHHDYSAALHNASLASRPRGGGLEPGTRTSLGRVALLRASLEELDVAERLAFAPADQALVHVGRARSEAEWGLPLEALEDYRAAATLVPGSHEAPRRVAGILADLMHPVAPSAPGP